jgi:ubiquinone/menaquinone biosynthesis C-methylase UbiE
MVEKHGHKHHGKTSRQILSADDVINATGLQKGNIFLDAGCGDGYISIEASKIVGSSGVVYALDVYPESIEKVKAEVKNQNLTNLNPILADITESIPLDENSVDLVLMANVLHGFVEEDEVDVVMKNISKVTKPGGIFSVVEFRKVESENGPPYNVRLHPSDVADILQRYGFDLIDSVEIGTYHYIVNGKKAK